MKQMIILGCCAAVLLSAGCTAAPNAAAPTPAPSQSVSELDPTTCIIAGERFTDDAAISLECGENATAQIIFEDGEAVSTSGQLHGWTPLSASHGTADDPDFLRVQIQNNDQVCSFGRKLTEDPKETWNSCITKPAPTGGKLTQPEEGSEA